MKFLVSACQHPVTLAGLAAIVVWLGLALRSGVDIPAFVLPFLIGVMAFILMMMFLTEADRKKPLNSKEEDEIRKELSAQTAAAFARAEAEAKFHEFCERHGGWDNMSPALRQAAQKAKDDALRNIRESGF